MKNQFTHSNRLPRPLLCSLCLLTAAIIFKLFNRFDTDYDLWWHIFIGNEIISKKALIRFDIYSFTARQEPFTNHEWISEIIMAGIYLIGGDIGLIIWRWVMLLIILVLLLKLIKRFTQHHMSRIIIMLCVGVVLSPGISFRVQLFSYLMIVILLSLIYSARAKGTLPSVFIVTILFVFWANLHGAFVLGLIVWFIYATAYFYQSNLNRSPRTILLLFLLPVTATLVNPFGPNLWRFIFYELSNPLSQKYITEWQRFSFEAREIPFFFVMTVTWIAYFFGKRKKDVAETIILLFASVMGLISVRHTPLFVILALPSLARHLDGCFLRLSERTGGGKELTRASIYVSALLILGLSAFFFKLGLPDKWKIKIGEDPVPVQTVAFLKENNIKCNLWVPLHYGGYVLFHLYPDVKVSIDGRWAMVYPRQTMQDNMAFAYNGTGGEWKAILEKYGADLALVETGNPAVKEMDQDLDWVWIFSDTTGKLLIKKSYLSSLHLPLRTPQIKPLSWP